jgi:putative acetyltransferase
MSTEGRRPNGVQVRLAVPDDAPSIASVLYESFIEYKDSYTEEGFAATALPSERIKTRMTEGPVWVALLNDMIIGAASAVPRGEGLYIRGMAILPSSRGQRIGELLLRQIESFASDRGFKRMFLDTTPFLSRAIRLYERFGFSRNSEATHDLFGTPLFTMEKTLMTLKAAVDYGIDLPNHDARYPWEKGYVEN